MAAPLELWHVSRTLRAMEALAVQPRSAPELAAALGVHVRTARRLLRRLDYDGYVEPTGDRRRRYRPTMRIVVLAGQVIECAELTQAAVPHITALRDRLGEDCHLTSSVRFQRRVLLGSGRVGIPLDRAPKSP